ncbi:MAG: tubulin-like doman-containing protein, partial [Candidatus Obscuribacterales bacterium]|nr:tubulin-like doman-containing protein [Candidatus Obscuribacterales bacterium]
MGIKTIPSLIVGLGGTGKRALTHLKRRIYDTYGVEELPWIRLLSIDADSAGVNNPPIISQRSNEFINLGNNEMRVIDQSDTPQVISNLDSPENRHILDWYPDPEMKVDFPKAARGSGQVRMFGRIGLYKGDNLHTTYRWLQQAAYDVSDPASWEGFPGFDVDPTLQFIYVICSTCGGTGSGMFLDVAYLLRKIVGVDPSTRRFMGMFVLPEVYEPVVENAHIKRIYANSYAALRELDYLMNSPKRSYTIRGKDHTFVDFPRDVTPFDFVFLFSNKNKKGAVISQRQVSSDKPAAIDDRVSQYISETIMTDVLSPVTERSESILSNIFTSIAEPETMVDRSFYKTYSAVGVSSVKVPSIDYFQDIIELRLADAVLDFLLRPDPDVTEKALAKEFFNENIGNTEEKFVFKNSLSVDPAFTRFLSKPFKEELKQNRPAQVHRLSEWIDMTLSNKIDEDNCLESERPAMAAAKATLDKVEKALSTSLARYSKDPERGFVFISEWVQELTLLINNKMAQVPPVPIIEGDLKRGPREALESFKKVGSDFQ